VGVGGGSNDRSGWKGKRGGVEGTALFLFWSPCGRFGTVMMGLGGVWVGLWCCYLPPLVPTPPSPSCALTYAHSRGRFFFCLLCGGWRQPGRSPEEGVFCWLVLSDELVCLHACTSGCVFIIAIVFMCEFTMFCYSNESVKGHLCIYPVI